MSGLEIPAALIVETVEHLRTARHSERVVLWLGRRDADVVRVCEVFMPIQIADAGYFRIPSAGMAALFRHMRAARLMVAGQVHTHPYEAFHSPVDDEWAIVRHEGGLSLVVPRFCQMTTASTFVDDAKVFRLEANDEFVEVAPTSVYTVTQ
jgi:hypothetical protein